MFGGDDGSGSVPRAVVSPTRYTVDCAFVVYGSIDRPTRSDSIAAFVFSVNIFAAVNFAVFRVVGFTND